MKKYFSYIAAISAIIITILSFTTAFAAESEKASANASRPWVMVCDWEIENKYITPSKSSVLNITLKNYSSTKAIYNIKLSLSDESGELVFEGAGTQYVERIAKGGEYTWSTKLTAAANAAESRHKLVVTCEYEDKNAVEYQNSDSIFVPVRQSTDIDWDGIILPSKITQDETTTMNITLYNSGNSQIKNAKLSFDIDGLDSGGALFIGDIEPSEKATDNANLRASSSKTGAVSGTVTLTYEDSYSKKYKKTIKVNSVITKKAVQESTDSESDEKEDSNDTRQWLFALAGLAAGVALEVVLSAAIRSKKQRKQDEMRL